MMFGAFHWYDLIPCGMFLVLLVVLALLGWSIGAGYAWMRRRQQRQPGNP